jgi:hypothetical protein
MAWATFWTTFHKSYPASRIHNAVYKMTQQVFFLSLFRLKKSVSERATYFSLMEHPFLQHHAMVNRVSQCYVKMPLFFKVPFS